MLPLMEKQFVKHLGRGSFVFTKRGKTVTMPM